MSGHVADSDFEALSHWRGTACALIGIATLAINHAFAVFGDFHSLNLVMSGCIGIVIGIGSVVCPVLIQPMASGRKPIHDVALWLLVGLGAVIALEFAHHVYSYALWR
jgi:uncharacterized membrane protein